jgi:hypothetical protein
MTAYTDRHGRKTNRLTELVRQDCLLAHRLDIQARGGRVILSSPSVKHPGSYHVTVAFPVQEISAA